VVARLLVADGRRLNVSRSAVLGADKLSESADDANDEVERAYSYNRFSKGRTGRENTSKVRSCVYN
jgi:hypothetical protein